MAHQRETLTQNENLLFIFGQYKVLKGKMEVNWGNVRTFFYILALKTCFYFDKYTYIISISFHGTYFKI